MGILLIIINNASTIFFNAIVSNNPIVVNNVRTLLFQLFQLCELMLKKHVKLKHFGGRSIDSTKYILYEINQSDLLCTFKAIFLL